MLTEATTREGSGISESGSKAGWPARLRRGTERETAAAEVTNMEYWASMTFEDLQQPTNDDPKQFASERFDGPENMSA